MKTPALELAEALRERLAVIGDEVSRGNASLHMARLRLVSERIEALAAGLPRPLDPQLEHFLARRSYDKALAMLEES